MFKFSSTEVSGIRPVKEYVVIRPDVQDKEAEKVLASGLIIQEKSDYKGPARGILVAISPELEKNKDLPYKVGDRVMYEKLTEYSYFIDSERFIMMKESTLLGVIE